MRARLVLTLITALCLGLPARAASIDDWTHDMDAIVSDIVKIHPNPFTKITREVFLADAEALKVSLPRLTEEQRMVGAMRLVASIGDGHTQLEPNNPAFADWYPIRIYQFTDGYFITSAYKTDADLVGAEILKVGGRPVEETMRDVRSLMSADNAFCARENVFAFDNVELMKGLGLAGADGSLALHLKLRSGKFLDRKLAAHHADDKRFGIDDSKMNWRFVSEVFGSPLGTLNDWTTVFGGLMAMAFRTDDPSRPPHLMYRRPYGGHALPSAHAYYIQINNIQDFANESLVAFFHRAMSEVDAQRPDRLIIDIRYNPGGDGSMVPAIIHEFIKQEDSPSWKHLYLLTGRKTFSAAVMMLQAFIDNTTVSLVGEPAGAGPVSFGDATTIDFPRSGIELHVSTLFHKLDDAGERGDITPVDVPAPFSFSEYAAGRDPAVDAILRGDEMRSLATIAIESGAEAARNVYEIRKTRYGETPEWFAPRRIDLLHAIWKMEDQNHVADAARFAALATDIYPNSARVWAVRGDVETNAGQKAEALQSYRRSLEIDPNNLDNISERKVLAEARVPVPE